MARVKSITGRDGYIMMQALVYAVAQIQSLPARDQEFSNMCDMCDILRAHPVPDFMIRSVEEKTGVKINLDPRVNDDEPETSP